MYNLLIVDDEEIAIKGIVHGIDWSSLPIEHIFEAIDAEEAKEIFRLNPIHVLLSDIDMPNDNGIALLQWVREASPQTETVFLSGHADFKYAQHALKLDSFDYLLKPVDHQVLKSTLIRALEKIQHNEEQAEFNKTYQHYYQQWNKQLPILCERFWQDLLQERILLVAESLGSWFELYDIPLQVDSSVQAVLISIEQWREPLNHRDEEIMTYAVKNAANEFILKGFKGQVIQDTSGIVIGILYDPPEDILVRLEENCRSFIEKCQMYLHCHISCYIGRETKVLSLRDGIRTLIEMERNNLTHSNSIHLEQAYKKQQSTAIGKPVYDDWAVLLEMGKKNDWIGRIEESFLRMKEEQVDHLYLESFYYGFVHMIYNTFQKMSVRMETVYPNGEWREFNQASKSIDRMKSWAVLMAETACTHLSDHGKEVSNVIGKVIQFIEDHLCEEFSREDIADHVFLNSAYLSRLFRKETGESLSDYILDARVNKAKLLLEKTNNKISDIASTIGYDNFSYFAKMFKKSTGVTPQEYRKKFQDI
jgi:two-component system response regulator YesN